MNILRRGLSYCVTCDAMTHKEKVVAVIGGSSAATMAAVMLSDITKKSIYNMQGGLN